MRRRTSRYRVAKTHHLRRPPRRLNTPSGRRTRNRNPRNRSRRRNRRRRPRRQPRKPARNRRNEESSRRRTSIGGVTRRRLRRPRAYLRICIHVLLSLRGWPALWRFVCFLLAQPSLNEALQQGRPSTGRTLAPKLPRRTLTIEDPNPSAGRMKLSQPCRMHRPQPNTSIRVGAR